MSQKNKPKVKDLTVTPFDLTVLERIELQIVLPKEGKYIEMTLAGRIVEKIKLTSEEIESYELKELPDNRGIQGKEWRDKETSVFEFTDNELKLVQKELKKLDEEGKLSLSLIKLYDKFIPQE